MPIAAKLFYFQRRRPPPPPPEEPTDDSLRHGCPAAARRQVQPLRSAHHHRTGYEVNRGSQRDSGASSKSVIEPTREMLFSSRLSTNTSYDRLPDVVQQAKDRLHQRLRSADLFPGRRQTAPVGTIRAGPHLSSESDVCASKDCRLDGPTICLNSRASISTHKVKETTAEPCSEAAGVPPHPRPFSEIGEETLQGTMEGDDVESLVDCSICLEGCHGGAEGLVQLHCKHIFHSACLEQWLRSRADCPYCRASVSLSRKE